MSREAEESSSGKTVIIVVGIIAGVILVIVLACAGLGYFAFKAMGPAFNSAMQMAQDIQQANAAGLAFLGDLAADRLDEAYKRTSKSYQEGQNLEAFRKLIAKHPNVKNSAYTMAGANVTPPRFSFKFTLTGANGAVSGNIVVIKEGEEWKIDQFSIP
jgi:hypothetical protein